MNAVSPRYASVLPPPVGKNSRSTSPCSELRSGCVGSASDGRFKQHERELERAPRAVRRDVRCVEEIGERRLTGRSPRGRGHGVDALLPHRVVGEAERLGRDLVGGEPLDAGVKPRRDAARAPQASRVRRPSSAPSRSSGSSIRASCRSSQPSYASASGRSTSTSWAVGSSDSAFMSSTTDARPGSSSAVGASTRGDFVARHDARLDLRLRA